MQRVGVDDFLELAKDVPVLDVRSPGEYAHGHIPGAYNLALFSDEERKVVGTCYKQEGREPAIKSGLDYFGPKMRRMVEETEAIVDAYKSQQSSTSNASTVLVHCWRGGMRSAGVAWLLDIYGFNVNVLSGGYKAYRNWALRQFEYPYPFNVMGGNTGSGKTAVLMEFAKSNESIIDLEGIARHKGSAFGGLGEPAQPTQEMFENELATALQAVYITSDRRIWIEDESQRIGQLNIPNALFDTMQQSSLYVLDVPFEERLKYISNAYGGFAKQELTAAITRIQKRLGGLNAKNAVNYLAEDNYPECFRILLNYYDKYYERGLHARKGKTGSFSVVRCEQVDAKINSQKLTDKINF